MISLTLDCRTFSALYNQTSRKCLQKSNLNEIRGGFGNHCKCTGKWGWGKLQKMTGMCGDKLSRLTNKKRSFFFRHFLFY